MVTAKALRQETGRVRKTAGWSRVGEGRCVDLERQWALAPRVCLVGWREYLDTF
jgi:hypothetical protein